MSDKNPRQLEEVAPDTYGPPPTHDDAESEAGRVEERWTATGLNNPPWRAVSGPRLEAGEALVRAAALTQERQLRETAERQLHEARTQLEELEKERNRALQNEKVNAEHVGIQRMRAESAEAQLERCQEAAEDLSDLSALLPDDSQALALCNRALAKLDGSTSPQPTP